MSRWCWTDGGGAELADRYGDKDKAVIRTILDTVCIRLPIDTLGIGWLRVSLYVISCLMASMDIFCHWYEHACWDGIVVAYGYTFSLCHCFGKQHERKSLSHITYASDSSLTVISKRQSQCLLTGICQTGQDRDSGRIKQKQSTGKHASTLEYGVHKMEYSYCLVRSMRKGLSSVLCSERPMFHSNKFRHSRHELSRERKSPIHG